MSRKRTRSSKTTPENLILIDKEVKERFDSIFKYQPMMPEKGFNLKSNDMVVVPVSIRKTINALKWERFCDAHSLPDDELVREFYASLTTQEAIEVIIRKKKDFLQQVLDVVTNLGSQWIIRKCGSHSLRREYLKLVAKVWFYFVRYSFMPISHSSTISMERMLLFYAILTENFVNVGKIILKEIYNCAKKKTWSAYFQSLVTSLCLRDCDKTQANLKGQHVQGCITSHDLERLVERVHELNQGKQEEPTEPKTEESTKATKTEANLVIESKEEESDTESNSPQLVEGSTNPKLGVEPKEELVRLSVEPEFTTPRLTFTSISKKSELSILIDMCKFMHNQQQTYWKYAKIRDD
ncbi:hypothetical protein J1N35_001335 [Gossypium stocksii]|uniref:Putative plant transposon protein domain-containing protein n=1 Tax=Gossypium stocksii TaxID=47602 RepID=A0A9D3WHH6_9ROSI|nr:hypothetical protein J1N35_001335 [Gossypium stocksii]